jgi:AraC family transcriptional regulator
MFIPEKGLLSNSNTFFHTPSKTAKSTYFYMISSGEFFCNRDYRVERNNYNSYLIMYIKKGSGVVLFNNVSYTAKTNDVIILNCHQPHGYYTEEGWETLWLHFDGNTIKSFFELLYSRIGLVMPTGNSIVVKHILTDIVDRYKENKPLPESVISYSIHRMLTEMILISSDHKYEDNATNPVLDAMTYIESNYHRKITINELSDYVNISPFHFSRLFKKETNYSPYEFIIKIRIDKARILLKKTHKSIKEIAFEVGFNCESNFVDAFHKRVNQTPKSFRNTHF